MKLNNIKLSLFILVWGILPALSFAAVQPDLLFAKANRLYAQAHYKEALSLYGKIVEEGTQSAAVYYNMGNASYKTGDKPSALLYYEKAHKISPNDADINANIRFLNAKSVDKIDEVPEFFLSGWWRSFILSLSADSFAVLSICFILGGSGLLILYFFASQLQLKRAAFYSSVVFFITGLFCIFVTNRQLSYFEIQQHAIVFSSPVEIKSEPADKSKSLFVIHEGVKVLILEHNQGWIKVRLANGSEGWMKGAEVREI